MAITSCNGCASSEMIGMRRFARLANGLGLLAGRACWTVGGWADAETAYDDCLLFWQPVLIGLCSAFASSKFHPLQVGQSGGQ
jgi:hypothetical protein